MVRNRQGICEDKVFGDGRNINMMEDYTSIEEEIQCLKDRIEWINVHETMFELSPLLVLDRDYCKMRLKELEGTKNG